MNNSSEYSKALFSLSLETDNIDEYADALEKIGLAINENPEYLEYLYSPAEPLSSRLLAINSAFSFAPEYIISFLKLLCENGRIKQLPMLIDEFFALKELSENTITAEISSAIPLSQEQKQKLENKLFKKFNKNVNAIYTIDKALLGGMKIEIDGKTLDGSAAKKLSLIKGAMNG